MHLTGGDPISARFMRQDFFTYTPQFKLTIAVTQAPLLRNVDAAIRRRILIVPFEYVPSQPDRQLEHKLRSEWSGILRWMIKGALDWNAHGLSRPNMVAFATAEYLDEQDVFNQWVEQHIDRVAGGQVAARLLFASWRSFAGSTDAEAGTQKGFSALMQNHGFRVHKGTAGRRFYVGLRLRSHPKYATCDPPQSGT
jgi:putative DNA primase/helicase